MTPASRPPVSVLVIACLYLAVGLIGFTYHFSELLARHPDAWAIEATEFLALLAGIGLLLRWNWARWLAIAWIAFHVAISLHDPLSRLAVHIAFFLVITATLLRPAASLWFRKPAASS